MGKSTDIRKGRMYIWPFLLLVVLTLLLTFLGQYLSGGLPWGIDDGVKRLMAREWAASGGTSVLLRSPAPESFGRAFFPIPPPFAIAAESGFRAVFPALYPAVGGICVLLLGPLGLYILPALSLSLLLVGFA